MGISTFPPPTTGGGLSFYVDRFTSSGTWVAPTGLTAAEVLVVGGGGGGGGGFAVGDATSNSTLGGGGGGGLIEQVVPITGGSAYTITVGAGGAGGISGTDPGSSPGAGYAGNASSFGTLISVLGGGGSNTQAQTSQFRWNLVDSGLLVSTFGGYGRSNTTATATAGAGGGGGGIGFPFILSPAAGSNFAVGIYGSGGKQFDNSSNSESPFGLAGKNGFGSGGGGAIIAATNLMQGKGGPNAGDGLVITSGTANPAPTAGKANFGGGGGGGGNNGTATWDGGAGGSGYVEVRYWA